MKNSVSVKINFRGGIISPGNLFNILTLAGKSGVSKVSFGLRQQLLFEVLTQKYSSFSEQLAALGIYHEADSDQYPNIVSSYPAEGIFINNTWLSEGTYKDILDVMDYQPTLKVNISDSNQSFTPLFTGNINWVAAPAYPHFWYLFIRFPKTNVIYEWKELVYTNDVARMSHDIEEIILGHPVLFYDNPNADGAALIGLLNSKSYITKPANQPAVLPPFNLPYYEGLNRYDNKYWLGIYRRDEVFNIDFLKALCTLCLQTKVGQLCSTPWKTIIVKSIEEKDKHQWNKLLATHRINMRHAANELNFQVEDHCKDGLELKNYLLDNLHKEDIRTFGICIGIKTRKKSEIFSSILIKKKPVINIAGIKLIYVYDILCSKDFNPNERTETIFSKDNPKSVLAEQLRRAILSFYKYQSKTTALAIDNTVSKKSSIAKVTTRLYVYQCRHCFSVYAEKLGLTDKGINPHTNFEDLAETFTCELCDAPKEDFIKVDGEILNSMG